MQQLTIQQPIQGGYLVLADQPMRLGQLVTFLPSQTSGYVSAYTTNQLYQVLTQAPATDTEVIEQAWWQFKQPPSTAQCLSSKFFIHADALATLQVTIQTTKDLEPGSLGFDLWFRPEDTIPWVHVVKGHDLSNPGQSIFNHPQALWPQGLYLYKATLFYKTSLVPLGQTSHTWDIKTPVSLLYADLYL